MRSDHVPQTRIVALSCIAAAGICVVTLLAVRSPARSHDLLFRAVKADDVAKMQTLLAEGTGTDVEGVADTTPLFFARSAEAAQVLIQRGADVSARSRQQCTPLHFAAGRGAVGVAQTLLQHGAVVDARDRSGRTALHWAIRVRDPDAGFDESSTADARASRLQMVELLVQHGAAVDAASEIGRTPLFDAAEDDTELVRYLIRMGADVQKRDVGGATPLHIAASAGNREIVRVLLERGADPAARDWQSMTPAGYADPKDAGLRGLLAAPGK